MSDLKQQKPHVPILYSLASGALAGSVSKTVLAPFDLMKINFQADSKKQFRYSEAARFLIKTMRKQGVRGLWRGNTATLSRIIPYSAINFTAHEQWKHVLGVHFNPTNDPVCLRFLSGSLAGMTATCFTYPLDVARSRLAVTKKSQYKSLSNILHQMLIEGVHDGLYRGLLPTLIGISIYSGSAFFTFETLKGHYRNYSKEEEIASKNIFFFGACASFSGQCFAYPFEVVRRKIQTANEMTHETHKAEVFNYVTRKRGFFYTLKLFEHIVKDEGFRGIYKGVSLNVFKGPIAGAISFTIYDRLRAIKRMQEKKDAENL